jgi:hypothetical protein
LFSAPETKRNGHSDRAMVLKNAPLLLKNEVEKFAGNEMQTYSTINLSKKNKYESFTNCFIIALSYP